jgi:hypothetical protein
MNTTLCQAIQSKLVIEFHYEGRIRIVEPFCYGTSTAGHDILRGYQIRGHSESGKLGWKLFKVNEMKLINCLHEHFDESRQHYNPRDKDMIRIYCRVLK